MRNIQKTETREERRVTTREYFTDSNQDVPYCSSPNQGWESTPTSNFSSNNTIENFSSNISRSEIPNHIQGQPVNSNPNSYPNSYQQSNPNSYQHSNPNSYPHSSSYPSQGQPIVTSRTSRTIENYSTNQMQTQNQNQNQYPSWPSHSNPNPIPSSNPIPVQILPSSYAPNPVPAPIPSSNHNPIPVQILPSSYTPNDSNLSSRQIENQQKWTTTTSKKTIENMTTSTNYTNEDQHQSRPSIPSNSRMVSNPIPVQILPSSSGYNPNPSHNSNPRQNLSPAPYYQSPSPTPNYQSSSPTPNYQSSSPTPNYQNQSSSPTPYYYQSPSSTPTPTQYSPSPNPQSWTGSNTHTNSSNTNTTKIVNTTNTNKTVSFNLIDDESNPRNNVYSPGPGQRRVSSPTPSQTPSSVPSTITRHDVNSTNNVKNTTDTTKTTTTKIGTLEERLNTKQRRKCKIEDLWKVDENGYTMIIPVSEEYSPEDVKITVKDRVMQVVVKKEKRSKFDGASLGHRGFGKSFTLPRDADYQGIRTALSPEGLRIEVPKIKNPNANQNHNQPR